MSFPFLKNADGLIQSERAGNKRANGISSHGFDSKKVFISWCSTGNAVFDYDYLINLIINRLSGRKSIIF